MNLWGKVQSVKHLFLIPMKERGILLIASRLLCMFPEPFYIPECMKSEAICVYRMSVKQQEALKIMPLQIILILRRSFPMVKR